MSNPREIMIADIGGTHARFALTQISDGRISKLEHVVKIDCNNHASLQIAWEAYGADLGRELPREAAIAVAAPISRDAIYFTNSSWMLHPELVQEKLGLDRFTLINDFGAVSHAVANLESTFFEPICRLEKPWERQGVVCVVGPGTGLGVAQLLFTDDGYHVVQTEGGHIDFAPLDNVEDQLLTRLRATHRRVSAERIVSGPGLGTIYRLLAELEGQQHREIDDKALWALALNNEDALASAPFDHFCLCLGSIAGNLALAQGANRVVIAGGLGARIGNRLASSGFRERFIAKGRFQSMMENIGVYRMLHKEPGLYGAAEAFLREYGNANH